MATSYFNRDSAALLVAQAAHAGAKLVAAALSRATFGAGGEAVISVAIFATILPTKESTAAILMLLIVGDVIACWHYRRDADWALVRRLLPAVVPGLVLGAMFIGAVDDVVREGALEHDDAGPARERGGDLGVDRPTGVVVGDRGPQYVRLVDRDALLDGPPPALVAVAW